MLRTRFSIRGLVALAVLVPLVAALGLSFAITLASTHALAHDLGRLLISDAVGDVQDAVENILHEARQVDEIYSLRLTAPGAQSSRQPELERAMAQSIAVRPRLAAIRYVDPEGRMVGIIRHPDGLFRVQAEDDSIHAAPIDPATGQTIGPETEPRRYVIPERPWYLTATQHPGVHWTRAHAIEFPPLKLPAEREVGAAVARSMQGPDGDFAGVLAVHVILADVEATLRELPVVQRGGAVFIIDETNLLVAASHGHSVSDDGERVPLARAGHPAAAAAADYLAQHPARPADAGPDDSDKPLPRIEMDGVGLRLHTALIKPQPGLNWTLVSLVPESLFLAHARSAERRAAVLSLGAIVISGLVALMLARVISAPVIRITDRVRRVAEGDYRVAPEQFPSVELQSLHSELRSMAAGLEERRGLEASLRVALEQQSRLNDELVEGRRHVEELNASLERRVAERTAQLEATNKELEAFTYTVSHDLRAPLRHINGFVQLLAKHLTDRADEKTTRYMGTIAGAATQMGRLIDDLLAFSRIGRAPLTLRPVDSDHLVDEVLRHHAADLRSRRIEWVRQPLPPVQGDPDLLRQVWANLVDNAIKYTSGRELAVVEIGAEAADGEIVFHVRDNGAGFDPQYAHKLFGVFQRLHAATEFPGTGIGLATVRRIVARHGGRTWAEGRPGEGATFFFSIPTGEPAAADPRAGAESAEPPEQAA